MLKVSPPSQLKNEVLFVPKDRQYNVRLRISLIKVACPGILLLVPGDFPNFLEGTTRICREKLQRLAPKKTNTTIVIDFLVMQTLR